MDGGDSGWMGRPGAAEPSLLADPRDHYATPQRHHLPEHPTARDPGPQEGLRQTYAAMLRAARQFHRDTGRYLTIYGDLGEIFAALVLEMRLNRPCAMGSDGRVGNDHVEVKTLWPRSATLCATVRKDRHYSKVLLVRISAQHRVSARLIDRKDLVFDARGHCRLDWRTVQHLFPGEKALTLSVPA